MSRAVPSSVALETASAVPAGSSVQRERILDRALELMSTNGAKGTSMRQLAHACGVNVAALYYYFPSKADILRSVIDERRYGMRLSELPRVPDSLSPRDRIETLLRLMWDGSVSEEPVWKLILTESLAGNPDAVAVGEDLIITIDGHLRRWLDESLADVGPGSDAIADLVLGQLLGLFVESRFWPPAERDERAHRRIAQLAAALA